MAGQRMLLWDLPTRLFHWLLAAAVVAAVVTGQLGGSLMVWHGRIGLGIVGLIAFRLVWGVAGSTYARFAQFVPTPSKLAAYLRGDWHGEGHNPLGALSVIGLLGVLTVQVATGLFGNDDIAFYGPLSDLVSKDFSNQMTGIHLLSIDLLVGLVALHVAAIVFYARVKKQNLVRPMITGWKEPGEGESARGGGIVAFIAAAALAAAVVYGASGAWLPPPPPPPPAGQTPQF